MRSIVIALMLAIALIGLVRSASAQLGGIYEADLPATDEGNFAAMSSQFIDSKLAEVRRLVDDARTPDGGERALRLAMRALQEVLDDRAIDETVTRVEGEQRWQGVVAAVHGIVSSLDDDERAVYENELGARAQAELELCILSGDAERFRRLINLFSRTAAGRKGARHYGDLAFERGDFQTAAFAYRHAIEGRDRVEPASLTAATILRYAYACRELGSRSALERLAHELGALGTTQVLVGDAKADLTHAVHEQLQACKDATALAAASLDCAAPTFGLSNYPLPHAPSNLGDPAWVTIVPQPKSRLYSTTFMDYPRPETPASLPAVHHSKVLVNGGETLKAIDVYTGKSAWEVTPFFVARDSFHLREPDPNLLLTVSAAGDMAYAALENPLTKSLNDPKPVIIFGPPLYPVFPMVRRGLAAIHIPTGRIRWLTGGLYRAGHDHANLSDLEVEAALTSFHHCLSVDDVLYAIGVTRDNQAEATLFALDPKTGRPQWKMSLCQGQSENTMFGRASREPIPAPLIYADGTLYIVSNLGGVIAVETASRSVKWVCRYEAMPRPFTRDRRTFYRKPTFANTAPVLAPLGDGRSVLVVAPTDSRFISCLDADTGAILWKHGAEEPQGQLEPVDDISPTVFIGVSGNHVYYGQNDTLTQLSLADGSKRSQAIVRISKGRRALASPLSGRPALAQGAILWPGKYGISTIPLSDGHLPQDEFDTRNAEHPAGNVVIREGFVLNLSGVNYLSEREPPMLEATFNIGQLLDEMRARIAQAPQDPLALFRFAVLAEQFSDTTDAAEIDRSLERVVELTHARPELAELHRDARNRCFERAQQRAEAALNAPSREAFPAAARQAEHYAVTDEQQRAVFLLRERWAATIPGESHRLYAQYADSEWTIAIEYEGGQFPLRLYARAMRGMRSAAATPPDLVGAIEDLQAVAEDGAINPEQKQRMFEQIETWLVTHGREPYATVERRARKRLDEARGAASSEPTPPDVEMLYAVARQFPNAQAAIEAMRLACANVHEREARLTCGDALKTLLAVRGMAADSADLWLALVQLYDQTGQNVSSMLILMRLAREAGQVPVRVGEVMTTLGSYAAERLASINRSPLAGEGLHATGFPFAANDAWALAFAENSLVTVPPQPVGEEELAFVTTHEDGSGLIALDLRSGEKRWVSSGVAFSRPRLSRIGDTIVTVDDERVTGISRSDGGVRWQVETGVRPVWSKTVGGLVLFMGEGEFAKTDNEMTLAAIDCQQGVLAWTIQVAAGRRATMEASGLSLYLASETTPAELMRIDLGTGEICVRALLDAPLATNIAFTAQGALVYQTRNRSLELRHAESLEVLAVRRGGPQRAIQAMVDADKVVLVGHNGWVSALALKDFGDAWSLAGDAGVAVNRAWKLDDRLVLLKLGNTSEREVRVAGVSLATGTMLYDRVVATSTAEQKLVLGPSTAFRGGIALMIRRKQLLKIVQPDGSVRLTQDPGKPLVLGIDALSGETRLERELAKEDRRVMYEGLETHEGGLLICISDRVVFIPEKSGE